MYKYLKSVGVDINHIFYFNLSRSDHIDIQDVITNPEIQWDYTSLSQNPNITWKIINNHKDMPWAHTSIVFNNMSEPKKFYKLKQEYNKILKELQY